MVDHINGDTLQVSKSPSGHYILPIGDVVTEPEMTNALFMTTNA